MPGVTIRNVSEKRLICGLASLFSACQAMSIPMTTVFPEPVAILKANAVEPGFLAWFSFVEPVLYPGLRAAGDLGQKDGRLERLDLAEEERLLAEWGSFQ